MKQHYVMPVGVDDFRQVREEYYYVDKTDFVRKLLDGHAKATLITRPRRFGKTLALSMLYYFFSNKDAEANRVLFEGSKIEAAKRPGRSIWQSRGHGLLYSSVSRISRNGILMGCCRALRNSARESITVFAICWRLTF